MNVSRLLRRPTSVLSAATRLGDLKHARREMLGLSVLMKKLSAPRTFDGSHDAAMDACSSAVATLCAGRRAGVPAAGDTGRRALVRESPVARCQSFLGGVMQCLGKNSLLL